MTKVRKLYQTASLELEENKAQQQMRESKLTELQGQHNTAVVAL